MFYIRLSCLILELQMNVVPGMITQFAFKPITTTEEMRQNPDIISKVKKINKIRVENSKISCRWR